jgi:2-amino-4-hydroxy-6-hydroxymethyldihydropteridine diphosphokinase
MAHLPRPAVDAHGTPQVVTAYVAIGANLGDARQTVLRALDALARLPSSQLTARSDLYRTAPHQAQGPDFVNAVARMATGLMALDLLDALQALESEAGRLRPYLNAPRTLDLDLLFYGDAQMHSPRLTLPHPRWRERAFVLYPLADVWPERVTPEDLRRVAGQGVERLPKLAP